VISSHAGSTRLPNLSVTGQHLRLLIHSQGKAIARNRRTHKGSMRGATSSVNQKLPRRIDLNRPLSTWITPDKEALAMRSGSAIRIVGNTPAFKVNDPHFAVTSGKSSTSKAETRFSFQRVPCSVRHLAQSNCQPRPHPHLQPARRPDAGAATTDRSAGFRGPYKFASFTPSRIRQRNQHTWLRQRSESRRP
jgi:hypothetical protein